MAQKFLSIKNFEKYQHYKHRNPPWIKLHLDILDDADFLKMPDASKWHYVGMLLLSSRHENKIPADQDYVENRLGLRSKLDLTQRFIKDHLLASCKRIASVLRTNADSETETETETEKSRVECASAPPLKIVSKHSTGFPDGFMFDTRAEEMANGYGLNVHKEFSAFRDHHAAKGSTFKDWQAAFRTWIRNAVKFTARGAR